MRIMVLYGPLAVTIEQLDEKGNKKEVETSVSELICHELSVDELVFDNPVFNKMHQIILDALSENTLLKSSVFKRSEDQKIIQFVTEIEMNQHELSANWITKHSIYTNSEKDKLIHAVMGSLYAFKSSKVEKRIYEIRKTLAEHESDLPDEDVMDLLAEQVTLEEIKKMISAKLGRTVIR
jgi:hypothetical protein